MRNVDTEQLLKNVVEMINTLEYDSMRSAGKAKMNASVLVSLYTLKDRYEAMLKPVVAPKVEDEAPVKRGPGRPPKS